MTWAELVKDTLERVVDEGANADNDIEKLIAQGVGTATREFFDSVSLARIASALYKLAGLSDEITEDNIWSVEEYD